MKSTSRNRIGRGLGRVGYGSLLLQWAWASVLVLPWLLSLDFVQKLMSPSSGESVAPTGFDFALPGPVVMIIAALSVLGAVAVTVWAIVRAPGIATKTASRTTHKAASRGARALTHHKSVSKKKLLVLTERLVFVIKIGAILVALLITWLAPASELDDGIALLVAGFLASVSIIFFTAQRLVTTTDQPAL